MKVRALYILVMVVAALTAGTSTASGATKKNKNVREIVILHTNDTHSCVYPLNENLADTMLAGRGGFLRRTEMLQEEDYDLLLDSGDFSQGSSYYTLFRGDVEGGLMNIMGYDAATIGNHEFDFGMENMARVFANLNFPIVCANYDFSGTPVEGLVQPYTIVTRKGVRIGIFGLSPNMEGLVDHKNWDGATYLDPVPVAQEMVNTLRKKEKCDVVICLSHLGWAAANAGWEGVACDQKLIEQVSGLDLVLGGHSHTYMTEVELVTDAAGKLVPVDQNGKHGIFIGRLVLEVKK